MKYILMGALLLFIIYAGYLVARQMGTGQVRMGTESGNMVRADCILLAILMLVYGTTAFVNLGSREAPETFYHFEPGGSITLDLGGVMEISTVYLYTGLNTGSYDLWGSVDGKSFEKYETIEQNYAELFDWCKGEGETTHQARYLWLGTANDLYLGEVIAVDAQGYARPLNTIDGKGAELVDEFKKLPAELSYYTGTYFDEIYHARTAYEHIVGMWPYEISHPPLGKVIMSWGIQLLGMNPFGYRFMGTLAGVLMLPFMYLLSKRMFRSTLAAFTTTTVFAFDFMHFVQTRIATIDSYAVLFIVAMYYFMYRFVSEGNRKSLALSGVCFGLGAASKWTCIYAGAGLGLIWAIYWAVELLDKRDVKDFLKNIGFCLVWFVLVPVILYYMSYYYYGVSKGMSGVGMFFNPDYAKIVWDNQVSMLSYHSGVDATHPYSSRWYQWIFNIRPILYYLNYGEGTRASLAAFLSPLVAWGGLLTMVGIAFMALRRKDERAGFILIGYLAQLVPWMLVSRLQFNYHYFACVVFLCLALGYAATVLEQAGRKKPVYALSGWAVGLFALFYPALSGIMVSSWWGENVMRWLDTWPL